MGRNAKRLCEHLAPHVLAFDRTGRYLAISGQGGTLSIWDIVDCSQVIELCPLSCLPTGCTFNSTSSKLAVSDEDGSLALIDIASKSVLQFEKRRLPVWEVVITTDDSSIVALESDYDYQGARITVWNQSYLTRHENQPELFDRDSSHSGDRSRNAFTLNREIHFDKESSIISLANVHKGITYLEFTWPSCGERIIRQGTVLDDSVLHEFPVPFNTRIPQTNHDQTLLTVLDYTIPACSIWDIEQEKEIGTLEIPSEHLYDVRFLADGISGILITGDCGPKEDSQVVELVDLMGVRRIRCLHSSRHETYSRFIASPSGMLLAGISDKRLTIFDCINENCDITLDADRGETFGDCIAFSPRMDIFAFAIGNDVWYTELRKE